MYISFTRKGVVIDLHASKRIVRTDCFRRNRPILSRCDIRQLRKVDKAARDFFALEGSLLLKALAFIEPPVTDAMTRFYLMTNTSRTSPQPLFREIPKAINLLAGRFLGVVFETALF
ncbi:MAG: hypothetical protein R2814_18210 [Flavobacteriaceae bacterium]